MTVYESNNFAEKFSKLSIWLQYYSNVLAELRKFVFEGQTLVQFVRSCISVSDKVLKSRQTVAKILKV